MSEIRTKLLSLSVLAMAFAGLSYGQVGSAVTCVNLANQNPTIRQEGVTEEVGDSITQCTTTTNATTEPSLPF